MAVRTGMINLISRLRALANAGTIEFSIDDKDYFSNDMMQDILDSNGCLVIDSPLTWQVQSIGGGTVTYQIATSLWRDFEEASSGTARWIVRDGPGAEIGTANYTPDYRTGRLSFASDQGGTAYYVTGYSYDLHNAAADVWRQRLANFADWYQFSADNQTFNRQQAFEHAEKMIKVMEQKAGTNLVANAFGDVRITDIVRTDINITE